MVTIAWNKDAILQEGSFLYHWGTHLNMGLQRFLFEQINPPGTYVNAYLVYEC